MEKCSLPLALCSLVVVAVHLIQRADASTSSKQPHIVFVMADDLGYNDIGYHGSQIKTPIMDQLSAKGTRLENYYVQSTCAGGRSNFMSGRYQIRTGLQHDRIIDVQASGLPLDSPTLADKLKEAGYATHAIGKWHLGFYATDFLPMKRGFDTFYGLYLSQGDHFNHTREWIIGTPYLDLRDQDQPVFTETGNFSTHLFTAKAIERIQKHNVSEPMFMYLAYQAGHRPLQAPEKYVKPYDYLLLSDRRTYAGMVAAMDEGIGNVTKALQDAGMWDNTVFVLSNDNGGNSLFGGNNYPLRGWKDSLWEGGIRGVGFVVAPNMSTSGTVNKGLIHISDWYPTLVNLAKGTLNGTKPLDGYDQWKTISENQASPRKVVLHNIDIIVVKSGTPAFKNTFDTSVQAAIRNGDWKLLTGDPGNSTPLPPSPNKTSTSQSKASTRTTRPNWNQKRPGLPFSLDTRFKKYQESSTTKNYWLFNITADPTEDHDLSDRYPEVVKEMLDMLQNFNNSAVPPSTPSNNVQSNPALHGGVWGPYLDLANP